MTSPLSPASVNAAGSYEATEDFTAARYESLVLLAKEYYRFEPFGSECREPHVLWRHDIDYSVNRAYRAAEIEHRHGVRATYFFMLTSPYYSLFEVEAGRMAREIAAQGHHIGLHFDPTCYVGRRDRDLQTTIGRERRVLEELLETEVAFVSFHNPGYAGLMDETSTHIAGLLNVYGGKIRSDYLYASDSGGFWRHKPIHEVLAARQHDKLHILTHPVWWCAERQSPRRKVARCVEGRAAFGQKVYDDLMKSAGMWPTITAMDDL
jgi:hypothetical protein